MNTITESSPRGFARSPVERLSATGPDWFVEHATVRGDVWREPSASLNAAVGRVYDLAASDETLWAQVVACTGDRCFHLVGMGAAGKIAEWLRWWQSRPSWRPPEALLWLTWCSLSLGFGWLVLAFLEVV